MSKPKSPEELRRILRDPNTKIVTAENSMVKAYEKEVALVLGRLATFYGNPRIARAFVTDMSYPSDFKPFSDGYTVDYNEMSEAVGVLVEKGDAIWQIAKRLRDLAHG